MPTVESHGSDEAAQVECEASNVKGQTSLDQLTVLERETLLDEPALQVIVEDLFVGDECFLAMKLPSVDLSLEVDDTMDDMSTTEDEDCEINSFDMLGEFFPPCLEVYDIGGSDRFTAPNNLFPAEEETQDSDGFTAVDDDIQDCSLACFPTDGILSPGREWANVDVSIAVGSGESLRIPAFNRDSMF